MTLSAQRLEDFWTETLTRDLTGFADPRTDVLVEATGSTITAMWTQRGRDRSVSFRLTQDGDFRWIPTAKERTRPWHSLISCCGSCCDLVMISSRTDDPKTPPTENGPRDRRTETGRSGPRQAAKTRTNLPGC